VVWEIVFMLVILKIPVVYLCAVVWWAIRAEPEPLEGATLVAEVEPRSPVAWWRRRVARGPRRGGPHGAPTRTAVRAKMRA
jgi:hypothetical protein